VNAYGVKARWFIPFVDKSIGYSSNFSPAFLSSTFYVSVCYIAYSCKSRCACQTEIMMIMIMINYMYC